MSSEDGKLNEIDEAKKKKIKQLIMRTVNDSITDAILGACAPCFKVSIFFQIHFPVALHHYRVYLDK